MLKKATLFISFLAIAFIAVAFTHCTEPNSKEPWSEEQLMPPAELAQIILNGNEPHTYIYDIGPAGQIRDAIEIGEGKNKKNIEKLRAELSDVPKDANIVIYCGCCPFKDCPNIRPAFDLLNDMGFKNQNLLNLPENLKVDWIDKGYPME